MLLYVPDNLAGVYQDSAGVTPGVLNAPIGLLLDRQYGASNQGPELCSNGGFGTDTAGWTPYSNTVLSSIGGRLHIGTTTGPSQPMLAIYPIATQIGAQYVVTAGYATKTANVGVFQLAATNTSWGASAYFTQSFGTFGAQTASNLRAVFTATATTTYVCLRADGGASASTADYSEWDSVSIRELKGYHGKQPTAASKPTLSRIPRKRGPELVINGGFDSAANWTAISTTIAGGNVTLSAQYAYVQQTIELKVGASYEVSYSVSASNGTSLALSGSGFTGATTVLPSVVGKNAVVVTCVNTTNILKLIAPNTGTSVTIDNVSVREVLEWSNAISLDGVDDFLDVTFRDYFLGGGYTFVGAWCGAVTGNSSFVLVQSSTVNTNPLCCPLFVAIGSTGAGIFERGDTGANGLSGSSYVTDALTDTFCVELLTTSAGSTGNFKSWTSGVAEKNLNYAHVTESLTANKVTIGAAQRSSVSGFAKAIIGLLCWSPNAMPDADRKAIARFAAYLVGKNYV